MKLEDLKSLIKECLDEINMDEPRHDVYYTFDQKTGNLIDEHGYSLVDSVGNAIEFASEQDAEQYLIDNNVSGTIKEVTGTGAVAGYATPFAFSGNSKGGKAKMKKTAEQLGYKLVKESKLNEAKSRYRNFKDSEDIKKPSAKVSYLVREIKKMLKEVNFLTTLGKRLKMESGVDSQMYWKSVTEDMSRISGQMKEIQNSLRQIMR